jgi:hypothetical protein
MSTLWLKDMQHKRISFEVIEELTKRERTLIKLRRGQLKMLISALCRPEVDKYESEHKPGVDQKHQIREGQQKREKELWGMRCKLVLWVMETLMIRRERGESWKEELFASTAYQVLTNASQAGILDPLLFAKYIKLISAVISD